MAREGDAATEWQAQLNNVGWGWLVPAMPSIAALFARTMEEMFFVGTGFAGPPGNQLVTARHVAEELFEIQDSAPWESKIITLMPTPAGMVEIDIVGIWASHKNNISSDLATVRLSDGQMETAGIALTRLPLKDVQVEVGETLYSVGFATMPKKFNLSDATNAFEVTGEPRIVAAPVVSVHDSISNIAAPVFKMEFEMPGGMSGGPILRPNGDVVGICSYGNTEGEPWFCYGSMLAPLWKPISEAEEWLPQ